MRHVSVIAQFRRVWNLLDPAQRRRFLRLQLLSFAMALATLAGLAAVLPFLRVLTDPSLIERNLWLARLYAGLGSPGQLRFLQFLGAAFVVLVLTSNAVNFFGFRAIRNFAHDCGARLQEALFAEYLHRDCLFHARSDSAVLGSGVVRHVEAFALGTLHGLLLLTAGLATCLLVFASVLAFHPAAALFAALIFGGAYAAIYFFVRRRLLRNGRLQAQRWDERARVMAAGFGAVKEILLLGNQKFFSNLFAQQSATIARTGADSLVLAQLPRHVIECVAAASLVAAAFWFGGGSDAGWFAELTFFALAAYRLMPALQQTFSALAQVGAGDAAFVHIEADLAAALASGRARATEGTAPAWEAPCQGIRLSHLSFRYASGLPLAIRDVSLTIPAGARVALVGANGSGKSTLADLIAGLLRPESGEIHIDDVRLEDDLLRAWQANIAYVPQSVFLQNASVLENIALGVPREAIDPARVRAALRQVQLDAFVDSLPAGCDEVIGERGLRISGGQRQLIGIARALYRDARVLILDEATNALDAHHERQVIAALNAGEAARITLVIAHHPAAIRDCDLVFELAGGELLATRGPLPLRQEAG